MKDWIKEILSVILEYDNVEDSLEYLGLAYLQYDDNLSAEDAERYDYWFPEMKTDTFIVYRQEYIQTLLNVVDKQSTV